MEQCVNNSLHHSWKANRERPRQVVVELDGGIIEIEVNLTCEKCHIDGIGHFSLNYVKDEDDDNESAPIKIDNFREVTVPYGVVDVVRNPLFLEWEPSKTPTEKVSGEVRNDTPQISLDL